MAKYNKDKKATFEVKVDKNEYNVRVQDVQKNYRTGENLNIQFVIV